MAFAHHKESHSGGGGPHGGGGDDNDSDSSTKKEEKAAEKAEKAAEKAEKAANKTIEEASEKAEKAAAKDAEKAANKTIEEDSEKAAAKDAEKTIKINEIIQETIKEAVIKVVDEIIEESTKSDVTLDKVEKDSHEAQKESQKGFLVAKVLSKIATKNLDKEYKEKSPDKNYREQLEKIELQLIKDTQKVKSQYFEKILDVNPGFTIEADNVEDKVVEVSSEIQNQKNPGIMVKKTDKQVRKLLQSENPDEDAWKFGIDFQNGKTRIVLELSNTDPATIEKIQSLSDIEIQGDNLVQITTDIQNIPRINSLQDVTKTRATTNLSDFTRDTFDAVPSPFLNSDAIVKTIGDVKYANLVQLSSDVSDSGYITESDYNYPVSEGVYSINADIVHNSGITGKDVKVAILDMIFDTDNPKISDNIVDFKSFRNSFENSMISQTITHGETTSHGTAVAEIISDVAPNSELYLYEMNTDVEFGRAMDEAIANDVDVIAMAAGWPNLPTDGSSHITKKVEEAINHGISVIVPSGNFAEKHWEGTFSDGDLNAWHEFAESDEGLSLSVSESQISNNIPIMIYLNWNDGMGDSSDFDLVLVDPLGQIVDYSANTQTSDSRKTESVFFMPQMAGLYAIGLSAVGEFKSPSDVPTHSSLELFSVNNSVEYPVSSGSVVVPSDAKGVIVVGAIDNVDGTLESFSSHGPTNNGMLVPSVVGPNGVTTIAYGGDLFYGTSATTPHVAGIVALMIDANSDLSPEQLLDDIEQNAIPNTHGSNHNEYGFGTIDAAFIIS